MKGGVGKIGEDGGIKDGKHGDSRGEKTMRRGKQGGRKTVPSNSMKKLTKWQS